MRSAFWLGDVRSRRGNDLVQKIGNLAWVRRATVSASFGRALQAHCHEAMTILAAFLPELYAETAAASWRLRERAKARARRNANSARLYKSSLGGLSAF